MTCRAREIFPEFACNVKTAGKLYGQVGEEWGGGAVGQSRAEDGWNFRPDVGGQLPLTEKSSRAEQSQRQSAGKSKKGVGRGLILA